MKLFLNFAFGCVLLFGCSCELFAQPGKGPSAVEIVNVLEVKHASQKTFVGSLFPIRSAVLGSAVDGRVVDVFVESGDPVGSDENPVVENSDSSNGYVGQPIIQIRTGTLDIEIAAAEIQARLSKRAFEELKISIPADIKVAKSNWEQFKSQLEYARTDFEMSEKLRNESGAVSALEMEQTRSQFLAAQQAVVSAALQLEKLESTREVRIAQSQLQVDADLQEIIRLKDMRTKYTIRAPFDGIITEKLTEVGAWLTPGSDVAKVVQLDPIDMVVNVPQQYVGQLHSTLGTEVSVRFEGVDEIVIGKVERIVPQVDLKSRSIPLRLKIQNPKTEQGSYLLQPGMIGSATLAIGEPTQMTLVKKDALVLGGGRAVLFKLVETGQVAKVVSIPVQTGVAVGEWIQVVGNIGQTDFVVLFGNERLRNGEEVKVNKKSIEKLELSEGS